MTSTGIDATTDATTDTFNVFTHTVTVTVRNPKTGDHRTFRVRTLKRDEGKAPWRVAELLTGPCNTSDFRAFANVYSEQLHPGRKNEICVWKKHQQSSDFRFFAWMLENPAAAAERYGLEFMAETSCAICNRPLTDPASIERGIGPKCLENIGGVR